MAFINLYRQRGGVAQLMGASPRYWNIWRISPSEGVGYRYCLVKTAQEFCQNTIPQNQKGEDVQATLLSYFQLKHSNVDSTARALAGLCLRCYISDPVLKACKKIDNQFGSDKDFTYKELLSIVLDDDGQTLVILDKERKTQFVVAQDGQILNSTYNFFSVKVLQTFNADLQCKMSLDNWAFLQTKQNADLKKFLSEYGFRHLSDWALLNRIRPKQSDRFAQRDRYLIEVFHAVYRRDRVQQRQTGIRKCPEPSNEQLREMQDKLQKLGVIYQKASDLIGDIKKIATEMRQYDIWSNREALDIYDSDTKAYAPRTDLPYESLDETDLEKQELLEFLHRELKLALTSAIEKELRSRISYLEKSKKYAPLAKQLVPGLQLYYCESKSLSEIAPLLGMSSWDQTRRVLNPGELLSKIRMSCVEQTLNKILEKANEMGLTKIPPEPDYLQMLASQIETFADAEIFTEAVEEIRAGKNRSMDSVYARQLRLTLNNIHQHA